MGEAILAMDARVAEGIEPRDYVADPMDRDDASLSWATCLAARDISLTRFVRNVIGTIPHPSAPVTASLYGEWPFEPGTLNARALQAAAAGYGRFTLGQALESTLALPISERRLWGKKFYFLHEEQLFTGALGAQMPLIITVTLSSRGRAEIGVEQYGNPDKKVWKREGGWIMRKQTW